MKNKINHIIKTSPIGIFDSGLGGLSITRELVQLLPNEDIIYLADSKNAPYGEKTKEQIIAFSIKNTELLLSLGCKIIVVACNTATTNAIKTLREKFEVPFIGIEPATKPAALTTKTGKIGVLATKGTLNSDLFITTLSQFKHIEIIEAEGKDLVRLIEAGKIEDTKPLLEKYLLPMVKKGADNLVLGCTHYPFLIPLIKEIVPTITIIDSGEAVAKRIQHILREKELLNNENVNSSIFYTNNDAKILTDFLNKIDLEYTQAAFKDF